MIEAWMLDIIKEFGLTGGMLIILLYDKYRTGQELKKVIENNTQATNNNTVAIAKIETFLSSHGYNR